MEDTTETIANAYLRLRSWIELWGCPFEDDPEYKEDQELFDKAETKAKQYLEDIKS